MRGALAMSLAASMLDDDALRQPTAASSSTST